MVKDSDRPDSIQDLSECLCDDRNMPLLHDPALGKIDLCFKALPHYEAFVRKREKEVNQRIDEGKAAAIALERWEEYFKMARKDRGKAARGKTEEEIESEIQRHKQTKKQIDREIPKQIRKFLRGDNQPIPIKNEHEIAHLYLGEVYNHLFGCNILQLNMDAILTILSKASFFPENLRKQASVVKEVRNK